MKNYHEPTKAEIMAAGQRVLKMMKSPGWKLRVHNNIGWHYSVYHPKSGIQLCCGYQQLNPKNFSTLMSESQGADYGGTGSTLWSHDKYFKDPNKAVEYQLKLARDFVNNLKNVVENAEREILTKKI